MTPNVLLVHGLGGTASSMQPLADALALHGVHAVCITLPGHGTSPDDLEHVTWAQWLAALDAAVTDPCVVVGQSMGGTLALALACQRPLAGVVTVNAPAADPDSIDGLEWRRDRGHAWIDGPPLGDGEVGYTRFPISALLEMANGACGSDLSKVACPVWLVQALNDDVVDPASVDVHAAALTATTCRIVTLPTSGHVATFGPDLHVVVQSVLDAVRTAGDQL